MEKKRSQEDRSKVEESDDPSSREDKDHEAQIAAAEGEGMTGNPPPKKQKDETRKTD